MKRTHMHASRKGAHRLAVQALERGGYKVRLAEWKGTCRPVWFSGLKEAVLEVGQARDGRWRARIIQGR